MGKFRASPYLVVFDGQSLNLLPGPLSGGYPATTMASFPGVPYVNVAIGSTSWTDLYTTRVARLHPHANGGLITILCMCGGTSDIVAGDDGGTVYADEVSYGNAARTAGFNYVIATTLTGWTGISAANETERDWLNAYLVSDPSDAFDYTVDHAAHTSLDDPPTDTGFYDDIGLHWNAAGAAVAASLTVAALQNIIV